jgi:hypothetical protein
LFGGCTGPPEELPLEDDVLPDAPLEDEVLPDAPLEDEVLPPPEAPLDELLLELAPPDELLLELAPPELDDAPLSSTIGGSLAVWSPEPPQATDENAKDDPMNTAARRDERGIWVT